MLNEVRLTGRVGKNPTIIEQPDGTKTCILSLIIKRPDEGEIFSTVDFVDCILYNSLAVQVFETCKQTDLVTVEGKIESEMNNKNLKIVINKIKLEGDK